MDNTCSYEEGRKFESYLNAKILRVVMTSGRFSTSGTYVGFIYYDR